jgi:hypothetical protein
MSAYDLSADPAAKAAGRVEIKRKRRVYEAAVRFEERKSAEREHTNRLLNRLTALLIKSQTNEELAHYETGLQVAIEIIQQGTSPLRTNQLLIEALVVASAVDMQGVDHEVAMAGLENHPLGEAEESPEVDTASIKEKEDA